MEGVSEPVRHNRFANSVSKSWRFWIRSSKSLEQLGDTAEAFNALFDKVLRLFIPTCWPPSLGNLDITISNLSSSVSFVQFQNSVGSNGQDSNKNRIQPLEPNVHPPSLRNRFQL